MAEILKSFDADDLDPHVIDFAKAQHGLSKEDESFESFHMSDLADKSKHEMLKRNFNLKKITDIK